MTRIVTTVAAVPVIVYALAVGDPWWLACTVGVLAAVWRWTPSWRRT